MIKQRFLSSVCLAFFGVFLLPLATLGGAENWPQFRGPNATGFAPQGSLPDQWASDDYQWQLTLPGAGVGSPAIYNGMIYLLSADPAAQHRSVLAIDANSGMIQWQKNFPLLPHHLHSRNTFASSTPYVDATGIFLNWADPDQVTVVCLDHGGDVRWERDLGTWQSQHGFGGSPVVLDGKLIVFNSQQSAQLPADQKPGGSSMLALDPQTGETIWQTRLKATRACYGVPILRLDENQRPQIVGANTGNGIFALNAEDGKLLWDLPVFSARCVSSPLLVGDVLIGSAGSGGGGNHLVAVRPPNSKTQRTQAEEVYRMERNAPYVPTPAVVGKLLFMVDDRGFATCADAETGKVHWSQRVGGNYGASPIVVGDKLLLISLKGKATVLRAATEYERLASFSLGDAVQATPAFANGQLVLRIGNTLCALPAASLPTSSGNQAGE